MDHVFFHGNSKTVVELKMAMDLGVGCIVLDNIQEIATLEQIAYSYGKTANVMIRLNPGIETKTHAALRTANKRCKFGISIDTGDALAAVKQIQRCEHLHLSGFHTHFAQTGVTKPLHGPDRPDFYSRITGGMENASCRVGFFRM